MCARAGPRAFELPPERLCRRVEPGSLPFESTREVEPLVGTVGQPRAIGAIELGLEVETQGYNLFAAGLPGSGRASTVRDYVDRVASGRPTPGDWVYVHDFDGDRPKTIRMPPGRGEALAADVDELLRGARREIPRALESEEYERRQQEVVADIAARREALVEELVAFAHEREYLLQVTVAGVITTPTFKGKPLTREGFQQLAPDDRRTVEQRGAELTERTAAFLRPVQQLEKEAAERVRQLQRDVALFAVGPLFRELLERYADVPGAVAHLERLQAAVAAHLDDFRRPDDEEPFSLWLPPRPRDAFTQYRVNAFVRNREGAGAPVIVEPNPTYYNLVGRIEYRATFGAMVTDFTDMKPGALHRANGGFLVLEALEVLRHPFAWDALKRAVRSREVRMENLGEEFSALPSASLGPEPIPLDVKVVLIGSPSLYHLLYLLDEDFRELFKVKADFAPEMEWSDEHIASYAAFVSRCVSDLGVRHFDRSAVARLIEHGARLREDQEKLSTRLLDIADVVTEAGFWAGEAGREVAIGEDVDRAVASREFRSSLLEERLRALVEQGTIRIDTLGTRVGQVNGISLLDLGDYAFGRPSRVTATVSLGRAGVQSIEREIELSGPIHSKGVLTLAGYLGSAYAQEWPLAVSARITFEQSYDEVEGDSASSTELYALLSALSGIPLAQGIAVTGSVDQLGEVQAVGGVTRKIEGFFALCRAKGLTGDQGVVIPASNVRNLMLSDEVVAAVRARRFHVWSVRTVDEGIEILSGRPAEEVHELARERLVSYAERLNELGRLAEEQAAV
ncbi:MAG TPA: ATP-binding protein [Gaiellaceae bacterium]|nr:ATP-binding protein [Gaiellaceae bacterium]